ncbi:hypothetical protein Tco_0798228 [Tanacetum coccineum]
MGLWYSKDTDMSLTAYTDADHAGCQDTRRSTSVSAQFLREKLTVHITPPNDDYVAPATNLILDKQLNEFGEEFSNIPRITEKAYGNPVKDIKDFSDIIKTSDFETFVRKLLHQVLAEGGQNSRPSRPVIMCYQLQAMGPDQKERIQASRSGNDAHVDDADIRPINDEEPMAEVQTTAEINIFATGQQHTEQPEFINEGEALTRM